MQREIDELARLRLDELEDEWDPDDVVTFEKIRKGPRRQ